jgi:hypothetical protein
MGAPLPPPGWYADPQDGRRWRWWDGSGWTANVSGGEGAQASGDLWRDSTLYVRAKSAVGGRQATVYDERGGLLASLDPGAGKIGLTNWSVPLVDAAGALQLRMSVGFAFGPVFGPLSVAVEDAAGAPVGSIRVANFAGRRFRLELEAGGQTLGEVHTENWKNLDFRVVDAAGNEVASTGRAEPNAGGWFTWNDLYWLSIRRPLPEALDRLAIMALVGLAEIHLLASRRSH